MGPVIIIVTGPIFYLWPMRQISFTLESYEAKRLVPKTVVFGAMIWYFMGAYG